MAIYNDREKAVAEICFGIEKTNAYIGQKIDKDNYDLRNDCSAFGVTIDEVITFLQRPQTYKDKIYSEVMDASFIEPKKEVQVQNEKEPEYNFDNGNDEEDFDLDKYLEEMEQKQNPKQHDSTKQIEEVTPIKTEPPKKAIDRIVEEVETEMADKEIDKIFNPKKSKPTQKKKQPKKDNGKICKSYYLKKDTVEMLERLAADNELKTCDMLTLMIKKYHSENNKENILDRAKIEVRSEFKNDLVDNVGNFFEQSLKSKEDYSKVMEEIRANAETLITIKNQISNLTNKFIDNHNYVSEVTAPVKNIIEYFNREGIDIPEKYVVEEKVSTSGTPKRIKEVKRA